MGNRTEDILLNETLRAREELLSNMGHNSNRLFTLINITILLLGIFSTSAFFIYGMSNIFLIPLILGISLLIFGIFLGLYGMMPKFFNIALIPNKIYELKIEEKETVIDKFLQTYLWEQKQLLLGYEKTPFMIRIITFIIITAIGEYFFAWISFVFGIKENIINGISLIIFLLLILVLIYSYSKYSEKYNELKADLEG